METQADMLISTLGEVIGRLGGRLTLRAELPGHAPVEIAGLGDIAPVRRVTAPEAVPRIDRKHQEMTASGGVTPQHREKSAAGPKARRVAAAKPVRLRHAGD